MMRLGTWLSGAALALLLTLASCSSVDNENHGGMAGNIGITGEAGAGDEAQLRAIVQRHVEAAPKDADPGHANLIKARPYYFREYALYPDAGKEINVEYRKSDARTRPLQADVKLAKIRFSTRLHKKRAEAASDNAFFRDIGDETLTFELRNNRWKQIGSLFVADKTEENVNGEWVPRRPEMKRTVEAEEEEWWIVRKWKAFWNSRAKEEE
jgi:hypothetical protein